MSVFSLFCRGCRNEQFAGIDCTDCASKTGLFASCLVVGCRFESHNGSCLRSSYFRVHQCDAYLLIIIMQRAHTANALTVTHSKQYHTQGGDMAMASGRPYLEMPPLDLPGQRQKGVVATSCKAAMARFTLQTFHSKLFDRPNGK